MKLDYIVVSFLRIILTSQILCCCCCFFSWFTVQSHWYLKRKKKNKAAKKQQQIESSYDLRNLQQSMWLFTYRTLTLFSLFALTLFQFIGRCWILFLAAAFGYFVNAFLSSFSAFIRWICLQTIYFLVLHAIRSPIPFE